MKNGRINERNTGNWSLLGEPKRTTSKFIDVKLSKEQEQSIECIELIVYLIRSKNNNYYSYIRWDMDNELLRKWASSGIIEKGMKKSDRSFFTDKEICIVKKQDDLELVKGLLEKFFFNI